MRPVHPDDWNRQRHDNWNKPQYDKSKLGPKSDLLRERGGCLTLWIGLSFAIGLITLIFLLPTALQLVQLASNRRIISTNVMEALGIFGLLFASLIAYLACLRGMWQWKRWGVYGIVASAIIGVPLEVLLGTLPPSYIVFRLFVQLAILYWLLKDKWKLFT